MLSIISDYIHTQSRVKVGGVDKNRKIDQGLINFHRTILSRECEKYLTYIYMPRDGPEHALFRQNRHRNSAQFAKNCKNVRIFLGQKSKIFDLTQNVYSIARMQNNFLYYFFLKLTHCSPPHWHCSALTHFRKFRKLPTQYRSSI